MRRRISHLVVGLLILSTARSGHAAPAPEAEVLIARGVRKRVAADHAGALELFQRAHDLVPSGRTLAQMGLAEASLRRWVDSESHLSAALASPDRWVDENRRELEKTLEAVRSHVAVVTIAGPPGAEVTLNGQPLGRLPLTEATKAAEGMLHFEARAPGHKATQLDVEVRGGKAFQVTLDLEPLPHASPTSAVPVPPPVQPQARSLEDGPAAPSQSARWKPWVGSGLLMVAAAAATAGIVWLAIDGDPTCESLPPAARCMRAYDTQTQGLVALGAAAATAAAGGLILWSSRDTERQVQVGLGPAALTVRTRF